MTLLDLVTEFCQRTAIAAPASVMSSADKQILQIKTLLQEGLEDMSQRGSWEELTFEASWTTTATESQGALTTLAPTGYRWLIPMTLWDRTEKLPLLGPMSPVTWQALKAVVVTGPRYSFRIRKGLFLVTPAPPAGHTWVFEYVTRNFILDNDGTTYKHAFIKDTDEILLPEEIVKADLRWRWKKEKGLSYAEDFMSAERMIINALGRDGGQKVLRMDDNFGEPKPGIFVPIGSWMQP